MSLHVAKSVLDQIHAHGEASYPEEGAGFLLGKEREPRLVQSILMLTNRREDEARVNRYLPLPHYPALSMLIAQR